MDRWKLLSAREKEIVWRYLVLGEKRYAVACKFHMSVSNFGQIFTSIFRIMGMSDRIELALFIGKHYEQIELDAIALGLDIPADKECASAGFTDAALKARKFK